LSAAETANAIGVSTALIEAAEAGEPLTDADADAITAFLDQVSASGAAPD